MVGLSDSTVPMYLEVSSGSVATWTPFATLVTIVLYEARLVPSCLDFPPVPSLLHWA